MEIQFKSEHPSKNMKQTRQDIILQWYKDAVAEKDYEAAHGYYDNLIKLRLNAHEPSFIKMLDKIRGEMRFYDA